jgi:hypothetical protein
VSISSSYDSLPSLLHLDSSISAQNLIEHSLLKDQYQRDALKRLTETHLLEDELKEANESNKILLAHNQELEAQLAEHDSFTFSLVRIRFWTALVFPFSIFVLQSSWSSLRHSTSSMGTKTQLPSPCGPKV